MSAEVRRQATPSTGSIASELEKNLRFDRLIVLFYCAFFFGIFLDAWAHSHGQVDDTFFTPWHGVMYGSFAGLALFVMRTVVLNYKPKQALYKALPLGYGGILVGVVLFMIGGAGDLIWHEAFGVETDIEALFSPTHLLLVTAMVLILGAPFRAAYLRADEGKSSLLNFLPTLVSMAFVVSMLGLMAIPAHPFTIPHALASQSALGGQAILVFAAGVWVHTVILMGVVLFAVRRWQMPLGSLTLVLTFYGIMMSVVSDNFWFVPFVTLTGMIDDARVKALRVSAENGSAFRVFAFVMPFVFYAGAMAAIALNMTVGWTIHVWTGVIVTAGFVGLLLSYLVLPEKRAAN